MVELLDMVPAVTALATLPTYGKCILYHKPLVTVSWHSYPIQYLHRPQIVETLFNYIINLCT